MKALELGCWMKCPETKGYDEVKFIGLEDVKDPDHIKADLSKEPIPFPDNYFDFVWCHAIIEHFVDPLPVMKEVIRVLKVGGKIVIHVPNRNDPLANGDITHYSMFWLSSMDVFDVNFRNKGYLGVRQNCKVKARLLWYNHSIHNSYEGNKLGKILDKFMTWFINKYPRLYNCHLFYLTQWIHIPEEIEFVLEKVSS